MGNNNSRKLELEEFRKKVEKKEIEERNYYNQRIKEWEKSRLQAIENSEKAKLQTKVIRTKETISQMEELYTEINLPEVKDWPDSDIIKYNDLKIELKNTENALKKYTVDNDLGQFY